MTAEPGRLLSLGVERDLDDAGAIVAVVRAWGTRPRRLVRYAITAGWEYPRYPRPLVLRGVKLPSPWPWSPAARAEVAAAAAEGRPARPRGLVHEHVNPIGDVVAQVIARVDLDLGDPARLTAYLLDQLTYAVITKAEDDQLAAAERAGITDEACDRWARYRAAGLDVEGFAPLDAAARIGRRRSTPWAGHVGGATDSDLEAFRQWLVDAEGKSEATSRSYKSYVVTGLARMEQGAAWEDLSSDTRSGLRAFQRFRSPEPED